MGQSSCVSYLQTLTYSVLWCGVGFAADCQDLPVGGARGGLRGICFVWASVLGRLAPAAGLLPAAQSLPVAAAEYIWQFSRHSENQLHCALLIRGPACQPASQPVLPLQGSGSQPHRAPRGAQRHQHQPGSTSSSEVCVPTPALSFQC